MRFDSRFDIITDGSSRHLDEGHTAWGQLHEAYRRPDIPYDVCKSAAWMLLHHAMVFTYQHNDAEGYATWIQIMSGDKFWIVTENTGSPKTRREIQTTADDGRLFYVHLQTGDLMQVFSIPFFSFINYFSGFNRLVQDIRYTRPRRLLHTAVISSPTTVCT